MSTLASTFRVDTHFHVFEAGVAMPGARYMPAYAATLDQWWFLASSVGVSHGVLVQPSFLGTDHRLMVKSLAAFPGRLTGIAVVEPTISVEEMREMHALGVRGVRFNLVGGDHQIERWTRNRAFWDQLIALGWHVELHTDPGRLPDVLPRLPEGPTVVIDHMAKPLKPLSSDPSFQALRRFGVGRVMVKLSGAYRQAGVNARDLARVLLGELGASALLWGSDWPCTNHENCADYARLHTSLEEWVGQAFVDDIICRNPLRLYWGRQDTDAVISAVPRRQ